MALVASAPEFKKIDAVLILFDISDASTFKKIGNEEGWRAQVQRNLSGKTKMYLVGIHGIKSRAVTKKEAKEFAVAHGLQYIETDPWQPRVDPQLGCQTVLLEQILVDLHNEKKGEKAGSVKRIAPQPQGEGMRVKGDWID